jgi:DNA mismatch endonuclease (patch repair protein)
MDVLTKEQRTRNMKAIKNKNTKIELLLGKALWSKGLRYRKNDKTVFGKPDFVFKKYKIVVFVDSEYFHGKDWENEKHRIKTNTEFWHNKIEGNIKRDLIVNKILQESGWEVIRFWGNDVKRNLYLCCEQIQKIIDFKNGEIHRNKEKVKD